MPWHRRVFSIVERRVPARLAAWIRSAGTAIFTPLRFSHQSGHFRSSFARAPVSRRGAPIPWYTYPCIDFLSMRSYETRRILEFGVGHSTLWWGRRSADIVAFDDNDTWASYIRDRAGHNVHVFVVPLDDCAARIEARLRQHGNKKFDVILIDGLTRVALVPLALRWIADDGMIVCDDAETFGTYDAFKETGLSRVDFVGFAPGVSLPRCTSVFLRPGSFATDAAVPIRDPAQLDE